MRLARIVLVFFGIFLIHSASFAEENGISATDEKMNRKATDYVQEKYMLRWQLGDKAPSKITMANLIKALSGGPEAGPLSWPEFGDWVMRDFETFITDPGIKGNLETRVRFRRAVLESLLREVPKHKGFESKLNELNEAIRVYNKLSPAILKEIHVSDEAGDILKSGLMSFAERIQLKGAVKAFLDFENRSSSAENAPYLRGRYYLRELVSAVGVYLHFAGGGRAVSDELSRALDSFTSKPTSGPLWIQAICSALESPLGSAPHRARKLEQILVAQEQLKIVMTTAPQFDDVIHHQAFKLSDKIIATPNEAMREIENGMSPELELIKERVRSEFPELAAPSPGKVSELNEVALDLSIRVLRYFGASVDFTKADQKTLGRVREVLEKVLQAKEHQALAKAEPSEIPKPAQPGETTVPFEEQTSFGEAYRRNLAHAQALGVWDRLVNAVGSAEAREIVARITPGALVGFKAAIDARNAAGEDGLLKSVILRLLEGERFPTKFDRLIKTFERFSPAYGHTELAYLSLTEIRDSANLSAALEMVLGFNVQLNGTFPPSLDQVLADAKRASEKRPVTNGNGKGNGGNGRNHGSSEVIVPNQEATPGSRLVMIEGEDIYYLARGRNLDTSHTLVDSRRSKTDVVIEGKWRPLSWLSGVFGGYKIGLVDGMGAVMRDLGKAGYRFYLHAPTIGHTSTMGHLLNVLHGMIGWNQDAPLIVRAHGDLNNLRMGSEGRYDFRELLANRSDLQALIKDARHLEALLESTSHRVPSEPSTEGVKLSGSTLLANVKDICGVICADVAKSLKGESSSEEVVRIAARHIVENLNLDGKAADAREVEECLIKLRDGREVTLPKAFYPRPPENREGQINRAISARAPELPESDYVRIDSEEFKKAEAELKRLGVKIIHGDPEGRAEYAPEIVDAKRQRNVVATTVIDSRGQARIFVSETSKVVARPDIIHEMAHPFQLRALMKNLSPSLVLDVLDAAKRGEGWAIKLRAKLDQTSDRLVAEIIRNSLSMSEALLRIEKAGSNGELIPEGTVGQWRLAHQNRPKKLVTESPTDLGEVLSALESGIRGKQSPAEIEALSQRALELIRNLDGPAKRALLGRLAELARAEDRAGAERAGGSGAVVAGGAHFAVALFVATFIDATVHLDAEKFLDLVTHLPQHAIGFLVFGVGAQIGGSAFDLHAMLVNKLLSGMTGKSLSEMVSHSLGSKGPAGAAFLSQLKVILKTQVSFVAAVILMKLISSGYTKDFWSEVAVEAGSFFGAQVVVKSAIYGTVAYKRGSEVMWNALKVGRMVWKGKALTGAPGWIATAVELGVEMAVAPYVAHAWNIGRLKASLEWELGRTLVRAQDLIAGAAIHDPGEGLRKAMEVRVHLENYLLQLSLVPLLETVQKYQVKEAELDANYSQLATLSPSFKVLRDRRETTLGPEYLEASHRLYAEYLNRIAVETENLRKGTGAEIQSLAGWLSLRVRHIIPEPDCARPSSSLLCAKAHVAAGLAYDEVLKQFFGSSLIKSSPAVLTRLTETGRKVEKPLLVAQFRLTPGELYAAAGLFARQLLEIGPLSPEREAWRMVVLRGIASSHRGWVEQLNEKPSGAPAMKAAFVREAVLLDHGLNDAIGYPELGSHFLQAWTMRRKALFEKANPLAILGVTNPFDHGAVVNPWISRLRLSSYEKEAHELERQLNQLYGKTVAIVLPGEGDDGVASLVNEYLARFGVVEALKERLHIDPEKQGTEKALAQLMEWADRVDSRLVVSNAEISVSMNGKMLRQKFSLASSTSPGQAPHAGSDVVIQLFRENHDLPRVSSSTILRHHYNMPIPRALTDAVKHLTSELMAK